MIATLPTNIGAVYFVALLILIALVFMIWSMVDDSNGME